MFGLEIEHVSQTWNTPSTQLIWSSIATILGHTHKKRKNDFCSREFQIFFFSLFMQTSKQSLSNCFFFSKFFLNQIIGAFVRLSKHMCKADMSISACKYTIVCFELCLLYSRFSFQFFCTHLHNPRATLIKKN